MTDVVNKACVALQRAAGTFREYAGREEVSALGQVSFIQQAEECEAALRDLRKQASGEERSGQ